MRQQVTWMDDRPGWHQPGRTGVAASLLIALLAVPIILACGNLPQKLTTAPASSLRLEITIHDSLELQQHNPAAPNPWVVVDVAVTLAGPQPRYGGILLSGPHALTCNGVPMLYGNSSSGEERITRQSPGGSYTFVYTDEHGQRTTIAVRVPTGAFAVTAPAAGATITLPRQPSFGPSPTATGSAFTVGGSELTTLAALDATPVPPATPAPSATPIPSGLPTPVGQVRPPQLVSQPPILIRYTMPAIPTNAIATFQAGAYCGRNGAPSCGATIFGPALAASGAYALTDVDVAPGYGFEAFGPGPGELDARLTMGWPLPPVGFNAARVTFYEDETVQIVWAQ